MAYKVAPLGFAYDALEPHIDAETMELHHPCITRRMSTT
jgi:superoxide dismutase, Fe-Mn family